MASSWGTSWGTSWADSWGSVAEAPDSQSTVVQPSGALGLHHVPFVRRRQVAVVAHAIASPAQASGVGVARAFTFGAGTATAPSARVFGRGSGYREEDDLKVLLEAV